MLYGYRTGADTSPYIFFRSTGALVFGGDVTDFLTTGSTSVISLHKWQHIAVVRSGSGTNNMAMYVNGTRVAQGTSNQNFSYASGIDFAVMNITNYNYTGYMSNFRTVAGTAVYDPTSSSITVPNSPLSAISGTTFLLFQSNRFVDNSPSPYSLILTNSPAIRVFSPFAPSVSYSPAAHGGSMYFNGSSDYFYNTTASSTVTGTNNFTVEAWIYLNSNSNYSGVFSSYPSTLTVNGIFLGFQNTGVLYGAVGYSGGSDAISSATAVSTGAWHHIAFVRNGSAITLYLDGTNVASGTTSRSVAQTGFFVGRYYTDLNNYFFNGYISNLRFVNGSAVYSSNSAIQTAPVVSTANTALLLSGTNNGIIDQSSRTNLITVGSAQINTSVKKYGSGSLSFNGTTDYLTIPSNILYTFGTGDFTVECWLYPTALGSALGSQQIILNLQGTNSFCFSVWNGNVHISQFGVSDLYDFASASVANNAWFHLAICRSGTNLYCFLNGVQIGSTKTDSTNFAGTGNGYVGSGGSGQYFAGYIDDLRITKGYARYTGNFSPPTAGALLQ